MKKTKRKKGGDGELEGEGGESPPPSDSMTTLRILGFFIILIAVGLMALIFPYGDGIDGNVLAGQMLIFSIGILLFFLQISAFTVS